MSGEVVLFEQVSQLPGIAEGLRRVARIFENVKSFEDVEQYFLKGAGLSVNTYRAYLGAVRDFYTFTNGLNPLQVTPAMIESWYDAMSKRVGRATACLRIYGLRKFFKGVTAVVPCFVSPFEIMGSKLKEKLSRTKKGNRTRPALTAQELRDVLEWLGSLGTLRARQDRAMLFFLSTSGLRAFEFCQLTHGAIQCVGGTTSVVFTGKGNTDAEQEVYAPAVAAAVSVFQEQFGRDPTTTDALFSTLPFEHTRKPAPMNYAVLYERVRLVGVAARAAGVIKRDLVWSPHMLRRTYATGLMKTGMDLKSVQGKTRHANIETLAKHYLDSSDPATPFLDKMMGGAA
jgi:site-specific recombinase XerD